MFNCYFIWLAKHLTDITLCLQDPSSAGGDDGGGGVAASCCVGIVNIRPEVLLHFWQDFYPEEG